MSASGNVCEAFSYSVTDYIQERTWVSRRGTYVQTPAQWTKMRLEKVWALNGKWWYSYIIRQIRDTWRAQTSLARQIITIIMLSISISQLCSCSTFNECRALVWKASCKTSGSLPTTRPRHATTIMVFFAQLLIVEDPDHRQTLIRSSLYHPQPLHNISLQSVHNFLNNVAYKQTNRQTKATET